MRKRPFDAVVLDIDETLAVGNSLADAVRALGGDLAEFAELTRRCRAGDIDHTAAAARLLALLTATGPVTRTRLRELFARATLRPAAGELVRRLSATGHRVALISSSFDLFVAGMAERMAVRDHYANINLEFDAAGVLDNIRVTIAAAELKHQQLHHFCQLRGLDPARVLAVGDSENDLAMFACAGNGVLIAGPHNHGLRGNAWRVAAGLDEIAALLEPVNA